MDPFLYVRRLGLPSWLDLRYDSTKESTTNDMLGLSFGGYTVDRVSPRFGIYASYSYYIAINLTISLTLQYAV